MRKYKQQAEKIDEVLFLIEEIIDARDEMREEKKYSNSKHFWHIMDNRYTPARERLKNLLSEVIVVRK